MTPRHQFNEESVSCHSVIADQANFMEGLTHQFKPLFKQINTSSAYESPPKLLTKSEIIRSPDSTFNQIGHLYALCRDKTDKFTLLFSLIKLAMIRGRTVIMCRTQM